MAPRAGELLRDFAVTLGDGRQLMLSDLRGRCNLVLVLAGDGPMPPLAADLATRATELKEESDRVVVIGLSGAFADEQGRAHAALGAVDAAGRPSPAIYVTDRFGEVFAAWRAADGAPLPSADEVLDWLRFINIRCEECHPPEWPVV